MWWDTWTISVSSVSPRIDKIAGRMTVYEGSSNHHRGLYIHAIDFQRLEILIIVLWQWWPSLMFHSWRDSLHVTWCARISNVCKRFSFKMKEGKSHFVYYICCHLCPMLACIVVGYWTSLPNTGAITAIAVLISVKQPRKIMCKYIIWIHENYKL